MSWAINYVQWARVITIQQIIWEFTLENEYVLFSLSAICVTSQHRTNPRTRHSFDRLLRTTNHRLYAPPPQYWWHPAVRTFLGGRYLWSETLLLPFVLWFWWSRSPRLRCDGCAQRDRGPIICKTTARSLCIYWSHLRRQTEFRCQVDTSHGSSDLPIRLYIFDLWYTL